ncbi:sugar ABC transporter substrate-binding protein [Lichenibacterium minor]|uniref:Sugar ABC transporter substrate-binding protein n=1 Tax=Lichenibacterium minor TaxID=2316528 RepID=A0A4V1RUA0_9HYPH|nr:substrate-binding domain-containing protein [Lichenibacterium minor]RYC30424.1 sugar ABC transporter substrate-binding protein [Lichenibacterium minor]
MKTSKRTGLKAVLAATAAMLLATPAFADKAKPVIGFTVYDMSSFIAWGKQGAEAITKANNGTLLWQSAHNDVNAQISQIQQFINQKVDVIIIAAVNSATLGPQIEQATKAGIPVIATNLTISGPEAAKLVSYVGPNDIGAGEQEAQAVVDALKGKGNVVVMQGPVGQSGAIDRTKGIQNILAKNPNIKLIAMQPANWERTQAYKLMQDWLSRYGGQIDGLISENDDMAIGAIQALKEKGLAGKMPVAGVDAIKDGLRAIRSGDMIETNLQNGALELGMAVQVAVDHVQGKPVPKEAMLQMPGITKVDVDKFYDQLFDHSDKFIEGLPELIKRNMASGQYANE